MSDWQVIEGFSGPGEFARFRRQLNSQVEDGLARHVPAHPDYGPGEIYGGDWYQLQATGEIWRLVPPDPPFTGLWEPVIRVGGDAADRQDCSEPALSGNCPIATEYPIADAFELDGRWIVLLDAEAYLQDPGYSLDRRRGVEPLRNLRAYANGGRILWEAEFPTPADYYYRIVGRDPLIAQSFSGYRCRIDPVTGRIIAAEFTK